MVPNSMKANFIGDRATGRELRGERERERERERGGRERERKGERDSETQRGKQ